MVNTIYNPPVCETHPLMDAMNKLLFDLLNELPTKHPVRPSALTNCARQTWYKVKNFLSGKEVIPFTPHGVRKLLTWNRGHRVEKQVGEWLERMPGWRCIPYKKQIPITVIKKEEFGGSADFPIYGEIDRVLVDPHGEMWCLDVKSVAEKTFLDVYKTQIPKESNYLQQQLYLHGLQSVIKKGILYYENANTQAFIALRYAYDEAGYQAARKRMVDLLIKCEQAEPPNREYVFGEWQCKPEYCEFHDYCYAVDRKPPCIISAEVPWLDAVLPPAKPLAAELDQVIKNLQTFSDSFTFKYRGHVLQISKLKTKLQLKVERDA